MRGEEHELHAADEIGAGHHHEGRVAERDLGGGCRRSVADVVGGLGRQRDLVGPARVPGRRQHEQRQDHKAGDADAPAKTFIQHLPDRRRHQCAERSRRRDHAHHGAAHGAGTARAATDIAIALAVQASEAPISTPAPIRIGIIPCAVAIRARPTMYISEPTIMIGRKP